MTFSDILNAVKTGFSNFRFVDVIDILIIALLIFWVVRLTRKTRAYQLLRGVAIAFVVLIFSQVLGLTTLSWFLDTVLLSSVVFIAIIFQPELRRAFEHIGRGSKLFDKKSLTSPRESLARVIAKLSRRKVGALIIFEKKTPLGDILDTGTRLDAIISAELVESIFEPNTPLHDGAIIISDSKIAAAACFIPLTNDVDIDRELGTRHRAAVSATLISDCVSLVVSEETGKISYAKDGILHRELDTQSLMDLLTELFSDGANNSESNFFEKLFRKENDS
ncbi:MAG: TIGR00159 family protein [Clostridiales bacterium]|nr:TIGR00159 family protein [Clostridiales bacterium]